MTTVEIATAADFEGDQVATAKEQDRILQLLDGHGETHDVYRADAWLWKSKGLEALSQTETLVLARVVAETDKAWLLSQNDEVEDPDASDPRTDWIPKSVTRQYVASEDGVELSGQPQAFLKDWENDV